MPTSDVDIGMEASDDRPVCRRPGFGVLLWLALSWLGVVVFAAAGADLLPLPSPTDMDMLGRRMPSSGAHWLGTDGLGRDLLSRLIHGARISLTVGIAAPLIGLVVGGALGIVAGYFRGRLETIVVGSIDVLLAFPPLVLALALTSYLGQTVANLTFVIGILSIPAFARVARAATLSISRREFILAARAIGATELRILVRELLPNAILPLLAFFLLAVAVTIVVEGALSFLGLGVPPPAPSWGGMIGEGRESLEIAPRIAFLPAITMFLTVLSFNIAGDTLRAIADPRQATL
jgi:peptide/nickel transport system permease protein